MKRLIKKNWGVACLLAAVILLCISGSLAAYTNFSSARRVISVKSGNRILFSSNLLHTENKDTESGDYRSKKISLTESAFTLEIYNYLLGDETTYNSENITYTLRCTLLSEFTDGSAYTITYGGNTVAFAVNAEGDYIAELSGQILEGNQKSRNSYIVAVSEADQEKVKMRVEAIPVDDSYVATNQKKLAAVIVTGELQAEKNWTGRIVDQQSGRTPADYDGFNYEITGNGSGTVTLTWDSSVLKIDPWFANDVGVSITTPEEGKKRLTFDVGGQGQPSAYQLQFYWTTKDDGISWAELSGKIKVSFRETQ